MVENMEAGQVRIVKDPGAALEVIGREMGGWHAYYASAAVESGIARGLAAVSGGEVLGGLVYYVVEGGRGRVLVVYYIASSARARRRGVARVLLEEAVRREAPAAILATISAGNRASVSFFRSQGFEVLPYRVVEERYGGRLLRKVSRLACGYEDEYAAVKPPVEGWKVIEAVPDALVDDVFREICYKPWRVLRSR